MRISEKTCFSDRDLIDKPVHLSSAALRIVERFEVGEGILAVCLMENLPRPRIEKIASSLGEKDPGLLINEIP
jgi:hypothetical protein